MNRIRQGDSDANQNDQRASNPNEDQKVKTLRWAFRVISSIDALKIMSAYSQLSLKRIDPIFIYRYDKSIYLVLKN